MGSRQPPKSYDETTLQALEQALRDVWQVLKAHDPFRDWDKDTDFRTGACRKADGPGRRWGDRATRISQQSSSKLRFEAVPLAMAKQKASFTTCPARQSRHHKRVRRDSARSHDARECRGIVLGSCRP